jgi:dTDP-4-amino-4,6-dideoxy-D-galactose acyltransferase
MSDTVLKNLDWDSKHFGISIASIDESDLHLCDLTNLINISKIRNVKCIYCLIDPNKLELIHSLAIHNFRFIDIRIVFKINLINVDIISSSNLEIPTTDELRIVTHWVEIYHQDSRFFKDKNFEPLKVKEMYKIWVNNYVNSNSGAVLVYKKEDILMGYIIVSISANNYGKIELIGVSELYRGKGVGEDLVNLSIKWFQEQGIENISVATQGSNLSAIRLYSKCNFLPTEIKCWYHYWS